MANVTHLPRGAGPGEVVAFDTGPGNAVLDALARFASNGTQRYDQDGAVAARGRPADGLLAELLADPWFAQAPPRSTGRERFGERYAVKLREVGNAMGLSDEDVLATAVELTSASIADAVHRFLATRGPIDAVFVSGGGVRNPVLMSSLDRRLSPARVRTLATLGVPPEAKEALAFAFLAHLTMLGQPGNVPVATGARHPVVLGTVTPGAIR
jgi:anhydro-N-acetylmuramic acid kinase